MAETGDFQNATFSKLTAVSNVLKTSGRLGLAAFRI